MTTAVLYYEAILYFTISVLMNRALLMNIYTLHSSVTELTISTKSKVGCNMSDFQV